MKSGERTNCFHMRTRFFASFLPSSVDVEKARIADATFISPSPQFLAPWEDGRDEKIERTGDGLRHWIPFLAARWKVLFFKFFFDFYFYYSRNYNIPNFLLFSFFSLDRIFLFRICPPTPRAPGAGRWRASYANSSGTRKGKKKRRKIENREIIPLADRFPHYEIFFLLFSY